MNTQLTSLAKALKPNLGEMSMNEMLVHTYKVQTGATFFRTFKAWKELGFFVKKGEKGFPIFSRPIGVIKTENGKEANQEDYSRFGTCYLFHENQVEKSN